MAFLLNYQKKFNFSDIPYIFPLKRLYAYTLAEVLIVMTIIILILLALPPVTKKVFKISDTRNPHGRFECFWKSNASGIKELIAFSALENGKYEETKINGKNYCEFTPPDNSIYFIIHAVGGGGSGALIGNADISNGDGTVTVTNVADLEPKQERIQTTSYLSAAIPIAWPTWIVWMNNNKRKVTSELPWADPTNALGLKSTFDVGTIDTKQAIRYRVSGLAGSVVSTFLPKLPTNVKIRLYPGKGGELNASGYGSGEDGGDTVITYIYSGGSEIEGLRAKGGKGGSGNIDSKYTYTLVGGEPTDFGVSKLSPVLAKKSGFIDVVDSNELDEHLKSRVPVDVGDSGHGETQFITNTGGELYYEYDYNKGVIDSYYRVETDWKSITDKVTSSFFRRPYFENNPNCSLTDLTMPIEVTRDGDCAIDTNALTDTTIYYVCVIGKVPETVMRDILHSTDPGKSGTWRRYPITVNYSHDPYTGVAVYDEPNIEGNDLTYNSVDAKFYDCKFNRQLGNLTCKTMIESGKIYQCTKTEGKKGTCLNGDTPKTRNSGSKIYSNGSAAEKMKCPASGGNDGAVVILW